jgi:hypothetical protein
MPLEVPAPRDSRFGSPLVLSRVHWVRPELVAEVKYLTWTDDNLLRQVVYEGLREDTPAPPCTLPETCCRGEHHGPPATAEPLKCFTVAVRQNVRRGSRNAWRDRPIRAACPANASGAPVRAACRPSPGNGRAARASLAAAPIQGTNGPRAGAITGLSLQ